MCAEAGVKVQFHTRIIAAIRNKQNCLSLVITESKSSRQAWAGKVFIDAAGDGAFAAQAGY